MFAPSVGQNPMLLFYDTKANYTFLFVEIGVLGNKRYIKAFMERLHLLEYYKVIPLVVFDGALVPSKVAKVETGQRVEVKSGMPLNVKVEENKALHLSQACLAKVDNTKVKGVRLYFETKGKRVPLGALHSWKFPQQSFSLKIPDVFYLSHDYENSVFFMNSKPSTLLTRLYRVTKRKCEEDLIVPIAKRPTRPDPQNKQKETGKDEEALG